MSDNFTKARVREFLERLEVFLNLKSCQNNHFFSKLALRGMKINEKEQVEFLKKCEKFGGYCDCEILMNAAREILGEETPW